VVAALASDASAWRLFVRPGSCVAAAAVIDELPWAVGVLPIDNHIATVSRERGERLFLVTLSQCSLTGSAQFFAQVPTILL
jgi:hypothetical protein